MNTKPHLAWRSAALLAAAVAMVGVTAACGTDADPTTLGWQELQDLSALEREVLADKHVDLAELERATQVYIECLSGLGVRAVQPDLLRPGPSGVSSEFEAATQDDADRVFEGIHDCYSEVSAIEAVWTLQNQASEEERQAAMAAFGDCVRNAGLDIASDASVEDAILAAREAIQEQRTAPGTGTVGPDLAALEACLTTVTVALESALPGLEEALNELDL
jgi:hypothetical protein